MSAFPPEKDLSPDDTSVATVIRAGHSAGDAKRIVAGLREEYRKREARGPADLVVLAVPAGKGMEFLLGLRETLIARGQHRGDVGL